MDAAVGKKSRRTVWKPLPAFARAVGDFTGVIPEITDTVQVQASRIGTAGEKAAALEALGNAVHEVGGAVFSFAEDNEDHELKGRVDFSRTDITDGRESEIVARCRDILSAASANIDSLADYGVNQAKLGGLKKKIDAFEQLHTKPRQNIATSSAATKRMPKLFGKADGIIKRRLDKLVVQFKESAPDFYNEYQAARSIVDNPGGRNGNGKLNGNGNGNGTGNGNGHGTPTPTPHL